MIRIWMTMFTAFALFSCQHNAEGNEPKSGSHRIRPQTLVILSESNFVTTKEGNQHPTGYFLSELAGPAIALKKLGHQLVFATPNGKAPTMDQTSNDVKWFKNQENYNEALQFIRDEMGFSTPFSFEDLDEYQLNKMNSVFVPGGHAPMEDLVNNKELGRILTHFHVNKKPTALICHGPAALLSAKSGNQWLYAGYQMTAFSSVEEKQEEEAGHLDGHMRFYLDVELKRLGANVENKSPWQSSAIRDRELITGQNPMSEEEFAGLFLEAIAEKQLSTLKPSILVPGDVVLSRVLYNVAKEAFDAADFDSGYRTLWIGYADESSRNFLKRLEPHVKLTHDSLAPQGLLDYVVYATAGYEIAYQRWANKESADRAFSSEAGKQLVVDAGSFMKPLLFKEIQKNPFK